MRKILIKIKDNTFIIKEKIKLSSEYKNIINTNVISCNELVFSDEYILNNKKIVATFINELTKTYNIDTLIIEKNDFAMQFIDIVKNNKLITSLILKEDSPLTFKMCEAIMHSYIKNVNCYTLQPFMIEYLDKYDILVESRNEILYLSKFMIDNNLSIFSSIFYKMTITLDLPMNESDEQDFEAFCKINKYLKTINVFIVNKNDLEYIIKTLRANNKKNIKIIIHENIRNLEVIEYLKNFNKKKSKRYKIYFKLEYSNEYLKDNIFKQTNISILRTCGYLILLIVFFSFGYVLYDNYKSMQNDRSIKENITKVIEINNSEEIINELNKDKGEDEKLVVNEDIASLLNVNPEVVGWIKINNTNIDYPIVQGVDNKYYLKHNFYLESDNNGWVFMDYRNDTQELSDNIILYAHNRYQSGVMFGTLQNTLRYNWYSNAENHTISFRTLYEDLEYQVFSVYKITTTTDYMKTIFADDTDRLNFFNMLKNRSIYDFGVELSGDDKIITLSTCADDYNRYVLHAVLKTNK